MKLDLWKFRVFWEHKTLCNGFLSCRALM